MPVQVQDAARRAHQRGRGPRLSLHRDFSECLPASHGAQHCRHVARGAERARSASRDEADTREPRAAPGRRDRACRGSLSVPCGIPCHARDSCAQWAVLLHYRMTWFERIVPSRIKTERRTRSVPEGLWIKCPACDAVLYRAELERNLYVCPKCSHHMRMGGRERLERFLDPGSGQEIGAGISPEDPLKFRDSKKYRDRLT